MIHNLFPTPVGFYQLEDGLTDDEMSFIRDLAKRPNSGNMTSEYNYLFDHEAVKRIADFANESLQAYFQEADVAHEAVYVFHEHSSAVSRGANHDGGPAINHFYSSTTR